VPALPQRARLIETLLLCGAASLVVYVAIDAIASLRYAGYDYRDQTISELSAVQAPTRTLWLWLVGPYELLVFATAAGVLMAARRRAHSIVGWLLLAYAISGLAWPFAPMHQREALAAGGGTGSDTMHLVLAGVTSALFFAMIVAGAIGCGSRFRIYSVATLVGLAVFGSLVRLQSPALADNEPTPWIGFFERINVFGAMLWIAVFAFAVRPDAGGIAES
jgi:hypothetical protein